jgi:hypothetical protein
MSDNGYENNRERTTFEKDEVVSAPMAIELAVAAQAMADEIKKLPPEAQPAALLAGIEIINSVRLMAEAFINALPGVAEAYSPTLVSQETAALREKISRLPVESSMAVFIPILDYMDMIEHLAGAPEGPLPTFPNYITATLINEQSDLMIEQLVKDVSQ